MTAPRNCQYVPGYSNLHVKTEPKMHSFWVGNPRYFKQQHTANKHGYPYFIKKLKNVSCECDRVNGWNSTLQAAWYIRHVRIIWFCGLYVRYDSFTQNIVRACSMFYPYEGYRSVTPLDAARVNGTIFHNHSVHWYYLTLIRKGRCYIKHDINVRHGKQNPRTGWWLWSARYY